MNVGHGKRPSIVLGMGILSVVDGVAPLTLFLL
jgi:hypothetical protein